jgi:inner membrane protease subunit 2
MTWSRWLWQTSKRLLFATPIALTITDTVGCLCVVEGRSMQPTFNPQGCQLVDRVLLDKLSARTYNFTRGDVVVLRSPEDPKLRLIKRLIALPGDWVTAPGTYEILQVPKGHCWVEGDNSALSFDSKAFGAVPLALLEGRVTYVLWPPTRIHSVDRQMPLGRVLSQRT